MPIRILVSILESVQVPYNDYITVMNQKLKRKKKINKGHSEDLKRRKNNQKMPHSSM